MCNSLFRFLILFDVFDEFQLIYKIWKFGAALQFSLPLHAMKPKYATE